MCCRARRSAGTQSTAVSSLLEESDDIYNEEDAEMDEELLEEGSQGVCVCVCVCVVCGFCV